MRIGRKTVFPLVMELELVLLCIKMERRTNSERLEMNGIWASLSQYFATSILIWDKNVRDELLFEETGRTLWSKTSIFIVSSHSGVHKIKFSTIFLHTECRIIENKIQDDECIQCGINWHHYCPTQIPKKIVPIKGNKNVHKVPST